MITVPLPYIRIKNIEFLDAQWVQHAALGPAECLKEAAGASAYSAFHVPFDVSVVRVVDVGAVGWGHTFAVRIENTVVL